MSKIKSKKKLNSEFDKELFLNLFTKNSITKTPQQVRENKSMAYENN